MKFTTTTALRNNLSDSIDLVKSSKDFLLVTKRGKVASALVNIDLFEDLLELADKNYVASIRKSREEYERGEVFSMTDVFNEA